MEYCSPPYKYGDKGGWCECSFKDVPNAPGCFRPECWDRIKFYYDCNKVCKAFGGMKFVFYAIHGCDQAEYKFYIGEYDSDGNWNESTKKFVSDLNLNSYNGPNIKLINPYPCSGNLYTQDGEQCCIPYTGSQVLSVQEVSISSTIVNSLKLKYLDDDCVEIPVRAICSLSPSAGFCHQDLLQCLVLTSDGSCCLGRGILTEIETGVVEGKIKICCDPCPTPTPTPTPTHTPTVTPIVTTTIPIVTSTTPVSTPASTPIPCSNNVYYGMGANGGIWSVEPSQQLIAVRIEAALPPNLCFPLQVKVTSENESVEYLTVQMGGESPYFIGTGGFCKPSGVTILKAKIEWQYSTSVPIDNCGWGIKIECTGTICSEAPFLNTNFLSFNNFDFDQNTNQNNQKLSSLALPPACSTYCGGGPANENLCLKISNYSGSTPDSPYTVEGNYPITINPSICYNYTGNWTNDCVKPSTIDIETIDVTGNGGAIYMSHKTKINGVCVDLTLTSAPGSVGSLCGSGTLSSGSGVAKINDVADGTTFNWEITTESCIAPTPTPTYAPGCSINFQIATHGCCIEYLSNEILRAVGDGSIYVYNITQSPTNCCNKFAIRVNGGLIYNSGSYFAKSVKDGDIILVQAYSECNCKASPVPTYSLLPTYKQPIGYNAAECPSYPAVRAVKNSITDKLKIILNKNFFRR